MSRRLLASYVTLTVVVLAALEIPLGIQYGRSEKRDLTNRIAHDALIMATFAEDPLERGATNAPAGLVKAARDYRRTRGGRVVVVNRQGISIVDTRDPVGQNMRTVGRPEIAQALRGNVASGTRHSNQLGTDLIYVAVPIASGGHIRGAVRITYPTSTLDARVTRYWLLLAAIGGVVLAAATLIGLRFARTLTRPLSALEHAAGEVGEGDLTARAPETGPPEIRAVAVRFNETVARLDVLLDSQQAFVADASHQLRTPLAALRLRLENLERDVEPAGKQDLEAALAEVERLTRLVDGLLALARADAAVPAAEAVDLAEVVAGRVEHWTPHANEKGVALEAALAAEPYVLATPGALEQVLDNLLSNAIAVSPVGTAVRIDVRVSPGGVELHVVDEGPGMNAEQRLRAVDRFWRAGQAGKGTGLGLAIVHRLVTADGGTVELREAPGGGLDAVVGLRNAVRTNPNPALARA
jgi:signal transduction histidine kinase